MKKISLSFLAGTLLSLLPSAVYAHERWFAQGIPATYIKPLLFSAWSTTNAAMVLAAIFGLVAAIILHIVVGPHPLIKKLRSFTARWRAWVPILVRTTTGLVLITLTLAHQLFAPDLVVISPGALMPRVLLTLQLLAGLGLITGVLLRAASILGIVVYLATFLLFPLWSVASYLHFLGIFIYLIMTGDPSLPRAAEKSFFAHVIALFNARQYHPFALPILRIGMGLGIIIVALFNKLLDPAFALEFVRTHTVNFMPALGFQYFSNELFVLAAGLVELLIGMLLVLGILPRLVGAVLIGVFTLTLFSFGIQELVGHVPLYAIAFGLIVEGAGKRFCVLDGGRGE